MQHTRTLEHSQAYSTYRLSLIGLACGSAIIESTIELVSPNGAYHRDGLIVPTMEHFKSNRGVALWPSGKTGEAEWKKEGNRGEYGESNYRHQNRGKGRGSTQS